MISFYNKLGHIFIGFGLGFGFTYILSKILFLFGIISKIDGTNNIIFLLEIFLLFVMGYTLVLLSKANTTED